MAKRKQTAPAPPVANETAAEQPPLMDAAFVDDAKAGDQLRELAALYEIVADAQIDCDRKGEAAKTAKRNLEACTNALLEQVRAFTHTDPAALPLFDAEERERDQAAMEAAADNATADTALDEDSPL